MLIYQVTIQNDGSKNDGLNKRDGDLQGILSFADHLVKCQVLWYNYEGVCVFVKTGMDLKSNNTLFC